MTQEEIKLPYPGFLRRLFRKFSFYEWLFLISVNIVFMLTSVLTTYKFSHFNINVTMEDHRPKIVQIVPETCHDAVYSKDARTDDNGVHMACPTTAEGKVQIQGNLIVLTCTCPKTDAK